MTAVYVILDFIIVFAVFALGCFLVHLAQTKKPKGIDKTTEEFRNPEIYKETREEKEKSAPINSSFVEENSINIMEEPFAVKNDSLPRGDDFLLSRMTRDDNVLINEQLAYSQEETMNAINSANIPTTFNF